MSGCIPFTLVVGLLFCGLLIWQAGKPDPRLPKKPPREGPGTIIGGLTFELAADIALDAEWKTDEVGMMLADVTLTNGSKYPVKDITIRAGLRGESGTSVGYRTHTLTVCLGPEESRTFYGINFGFVPQQTEKVAFKVLSCYVDDSE